MQSFHITIEESTPPGPSKQHFLRRIVTSVDKHGFGKELWVMGYDSGTHVVAAAAATADNSSDSDASKLVMCTGGIVFLPESLAKWPSPTPVSEEEEALEHNEELSSSRVPENSLVVFVSSANDNGYSREVDLSPNVLNFLHKHRKVAAVAVSAMQRWSPTATTPSPLPIVYRCAPNLQVDAFSGGGTGAVGSGRVAAFILPLHYGSVSRNILPTCIMTIPLLGGGGPTTVRLLRDCTQKITPTSSLLKCGDLYNAQKPLHFPTTCGDNNSGRGGFVVPNNNNINCGGAMLVTCDVGTHVDSPKHFILNQRSISDLTPQELYAPGVVIDITDKLASLLPSSSSSSSSCADADAEVTLADIHAWEERNKRQIPDGALVCMRSGWSSRFNAGDDSYANKDSDGVCHFPGFSLEAADFLVAHRNVMGIGVDTFSTDVGSSTAFAVHHRVLKESKYNVENLDLMGLPDCGFHFVTAPMCVKGAHEAPARCIAVTMMD